MTILNTNSVEQKLASCNSRQEAWKLDHEEAKLVYRIEVLLGDMVELYAEMEALDSRYRKLIARAPNCYDHDFDLRLKEDCRNYLALARDINNTTLNGFSDYDVDNIAEFRRCLEKAKMSSKHDFDLEAIIDYKSNLPSMAELDGAMEAGINTDC